MTKTYTPQQKVQALSLLEEPNASIKSVSRQLDIPERTLYAWRKESRFQAQLQQIQAKNTFAAEQNLQQLQQNSQLPALEQSAFGMTREQLAKALEVEYIPSPYDTLRRSLLSHINVVQASISEDPNLAHVRALAVSSMLNDVFRLEELCRLEKPQLSVIKYEYKDGTYHDIPEWSNVVYSRADQAYQAVLIQARREYYALKGEVYDDSPYPTSPDQYYDTVEQPTLAELAEMHFTAEDFIPRHTGFLAWMQNRNSPSQYDQPSAADYEVFNGD